MSESRCLKGGSRPYVGDTDSVIDGHPGTRGCGRGFTITGTITVTFVTTLPEPPPTSNPLLGGTISAVSPTEPTPLPSVSSSSSLSINSLNRPSPFDMISSPLSSATFAASSNASSATGGALPSAAIVGIVIAVVVLLFILVFLLTWQRRRRARREWLNGLEKSLRAMASKSASEKEGASDGRQQPTSDAHNYKITDKDNLTAYQTNNRNAPRIAPTSVVTSPIKATVVNTFITDLPDELPVTFGQRLNVLAEYDDGWTLCANEKGEQGVVPIECLARDSVTGISTR